MLLHLKQCVHKMPDRLTDSSHNSISVICRRNDWKSSQIHSLVSLMRVCVLRHSLKLQIFVMYPHQTFVIYLMHLLGPNRRHKDAYAHQCDSGEANQLSHKKEHQIFLIYLNLIILLGLVRYLRIVRSRQSINKDDDRIPMSALTTNQHVSMRAHKDRLLLRFIIHLSI